VFGLTAAFPVYEWTDGDVWEYLDAIEPVRIVSSKRSLEGEGPLLGTPTLFCRVADDVKPMMDDTPGVLLRDVDATGCHALYVNTQHPSDKLISECLKFNLPVTVDCPMSQIYFISSEYRQHHQVQYFLEDANFGGTSATCPFHGFVKITADLRSRPLETYINQANLHAIYGHRVLLMPRYRENVLSAAELGQLSVKFIDRLHANVRLMPPVHELLEID